MTVLMYHKRFAAALVAGSKTQTIRPLRKRLIRIGDQLSHRVWDGVAYRSKQVELLTNKCEALFPVHVEINGVALGDNILITEAINHKWLNEFAQSDGFQDWYEMRQWYVVPGVGYGLPFSGVLIKWGVVCEMCGQDYQPNIRGSFLKGLCPKCSEGLGGKEHSATIVREERKQMQRARSK